MCRAKVVEFHSIYNYHSRMNNPYSYAILSFLTVFSTSLVQGKLVKYTFDIDYDVGSPDGVRNPWILKINKQFPGPTIEAVEGDILQIDVTNSIRDGQNTSIHWHGIHQKGSPFQDGPSMITQCPLKYGQTQRYRFKLDQLGTYWYHSHVQSQYSEGLWGPIIIYPKDPPVYSYDHDLTITLNDWYHSRSSILEEWYLSKANTEGVTPFPDSVLLNGRGRYPCDKARERKLPCSSSSQRRHVFIIPAKSRIRIRVINTSSRTSFLFSIDSHTLQTIEVDGVDVAQPLVDVDVAHIAPAQRYSFIISTDNQGNTDRFLIRAQAILKPDPAPDTVQGKCPECTAAVVTGILQYDRKIRKNMQIRRRTEIFDFYETIPPKPATPRLLDESQLLPHDGTIAPTNIDMRIVLNANVIQTTPEGLFRFAFNDTLFQLPVDEPLLHQVVRGVDLPPAFPYVHLPQLGNRVEIVINNFVGSHPFHMHGHHFYVVGKFPMRKDPEGNPLPYDEMEDGWRINATAVRRDTVFVEAENIVVLRFNADNYGVWAVHCHIDWHNLGGMAFVLLEGEDFLRNNLVVPQNMKRICRK